uniref:Uncharacterized protein n=1 Tax=Trypanosoma vivax (strain Y486) TaxID=1055687 RepID=G0TSX1_TRYVY|nr:conserved hypothetical protein [Trypanosoma vivax Y486]
MRLLRRLQQRIRARYELARARQFFRGISDHELIGRYCGLALIPFTICICTGHMNTYATNRVQNELARRGK